MKDFTKDTSPDGGPSRFYYTQSHIYGMTVYDRDAQLPAFSFGADTNMKEFKAMTLANHLNGTCRRTLTLCRRRTDTLTNNDIKVIINDVLAQDRDGRPVKVEVIQAVINNYLVENPSRCDHLWDTPDEDGNITCLKCKTRYKVVVSNE